MANSCHMAAGQKPVITPGEHPNPHQTRLTGWWIYSKMVPLALTQSHIESPALRSCIAHRAWEVVDSLPLHHALIHGIPNIWARPLDHVVAAKSRNHPVVLEGLLSHLLKTHCIKMVYPEPCKELRMRPQLFKKAAATISGWDCPLLTFIYLNRF